MIPDNGPVKWLEETFDIAERTGDHPINFHAYYWYSFKEEGCACTSTTVGTCSGDGYTPMVGAKYKMSLDSYKKWAGMTGRWPAPFKGYIA